MNKVKLVIVGAGSRGYYTFGRIASENSEKFEIVAVAEPDDEKRKRFVTSYKVDPSNAFSDWRELLDRMGKAADVAIIATPDYEHVEPAVAFAEAGYNLVLEKPIAPRPDDLVRVHKAVKKSGVVTLVPHVLRYTPFYRKVKEIVDSGAVGEIKGIDHREQVGFFHFAHSFVRGNWRREDETAPSILTKSCHDMDIMLWLLSSNIKKVSAFGDILFFNEDHKPPQATDRCLDCPLKEDCPYSAVKIYLLSGNTGWPTNTITTDLSREGILKALREGPYGRCVFKCDNDVCDYYAVAIEFEGGVMGTFTLTAFSNEITRHTTLFGTHGEVTGDLLRGRIELKVYGKETELIEVETPNSGHLGGDEGLMEHMYRVINGLEKPLTTIEESLESHYVAFAVEESRKTHRFVEIEDYKGRFYNERS